MRQNVPKVSYVSFLDVWMVTCLVFVNGCMFEFILVTALVNRGMEGLGDKVTNIEKYMCISVLFFFKQGGADKSSSYSFCIWTFQPNLLAYCPINMKSCTC